MLELRETTTALCIGLPSCLDALLSAKMIPLAAQLMEAAEGGGRLPDTSHCMVLREDICLASPA